MTERRHKARRRYADAAERIAATFVQAFAASLILTGLDDALDAVKLAAVAGALSAAKAVAGWGIGNRETSSTLPQDLDPATPPGQA